MRFELPAVAHVGLALLDGKNFQSSVRVLSEGQAGPDVSFKINPGPPAGTVAGRILHKARHRAVVGADGENLQPAIVVLPHAQPRQHGAAKTGPCRPIRGGVALPLPAMDQMLALIHAEEFQPSVVIGRDRQPRGGAFAQILPVRPSSMRVGLPKMLHPLAKSIEGENLQSAIRLLPQGHWRINHSAKIPPGVPFVTVAGLLADAVKLARLVHGKDLQPSVRIKADRHPRKKGAAKNGPGRPIPVAFLLPAMAGLAIQTYLE